MIMMETIDGHEMTLPLVAVALLLSQISKVLTPSFYHTPVHRFRGLVSYLATQKTQAGTAPCAMSLLRF